MHGAGLRVSDLKPQDRPAVEAWVAGLSEQTRYFRLHGAVSSDASALVAPLFVPNPQRLVVLAWEDQPNGVVVGGAQCVLTPGPAEFAMVVTDAWQRRGVGTRLLDVLMARARLHGVRAFRGAVLASNHGMRTFCARRGFAVEPSPRDHATVTVQKEFPSAA
jgi:acetyltransferase